MRFSTSLIFLGAVISSLPAFAAPSTYEQSVYARNYDLYGREESGLNLVARSTDAERIAAQWRHENNPHAPSPPPSSHGSQDNLIGGSSQPKKEGKLKKAAKTVANVFKFGKKKQDKRDVIETELLARDIESLLRREYPTLAARLDARDEFQWWA